MVTAESARGDGRNHWSRAPISSKCAANDRFGVLKTVRFAQFSHRCWRRLRCAPAGGCGKWGKEFSAGCVRFRGKLLGKGRRSGGRVVARCTVRTAREVGEGFFRGIFALPRDVFRGGRRSPGKGGRPGGVARTAPHRERTPPSSALRPGIGTDSAGATRQRAVARGKGMSAAGRRVTNSDLSDPDLATREAACRAEGDVDILVA